MRAANRMYRNVPVAAVGTTAATTAATSVARAGYSRNAPIVAVILIVIVAVRLHELVPKIAMLRPALMIGIIGAGMILLQSRQVVLRDVMSNPVFRWLLAMLAWAVVTAPLALWPTLAVSSAVSILLPILMMTFVILACEPNARNLYLLKLGLMGGAAAHGLWLLIKRDFDSRYRMGSVASLDSNDLAVLMVIAFPFSVSMALHSRGKRRWIAVLAAVVFLTVVVYTSSRGGTLAMVATGLVYVASAKGFRRGLAFILLLVGGLLTWNLAPANFRTAMRSITNLESDYNTFEYDGRKAIWARARGYIKENPVAGVGMLNFSVAEGNYLTAAGTRGKWSNTHNMYLQVTSELGFVGAIIFLSLLGLAAAKAWALRRPLWSNPELRSGQPEYLAALAGAAAGGYFLSHAYFYPLYALVALTLFAHRVSIATSVPSATAPVANVVKSRGARGFRSLRTAHLSR